MPTARLRRPPLHLLGAPPGGLSLAHVAGRLDGGDELEDDVADTDDADDAAGNVADDGLAEEHAAEEDVDWCARMVSACAKDNAGVVTGSGKYLQKPRPMKEKRKEAYLEIWGGIWNSGQIVSRCVEDDRGRRGETYRAEQQPDRK